MPTEKQLAARTNHIGGSDLSALFGMSPWTTAMDLWLDKTGQLAPQTTTEAMRRGNLLEDAVLEWASSVEGGGLGKLLRNQERAAKFAHLKVHTDAVTLDTEKQEPVEGKTVSYPASEKWGKETYEVPAEVIFQCQGHCICLRSDICHVPVLFGNFEFRMYRVERNEKLCRHIERVVIAWWELVERREPPTAEWYADMGLPGVTPHMLTPSADVLKRLIRAPGKTVPVDQAVVHEWLEAKKALTEATAGEAFYKTNMLRELKDGDAGVYEDEDGVHAVTFFETTRNNKAKEASVSTFRVLRHRPKGLET